MGMRFNPYWHEDIKCYFCGSEDMQRIIQMNGWKEING